MFLSFAAEQICLMLFRNYENRHQKVESLIQAWYGQNCEFRVYSRLSVSYFSVNIPWNAVWNVGL